MTPTRSSTQDQIAPVPMRQRSRVRLASTSAGASGYSSGVALSAGAPVPLPSVATVALNRMGFGPRPGDVEAFEALGATDQARLEAYVDQQLNPGAISDAEVEQRLAAAGFSTLGKTRAQLWADHAVSPGGDVWATRIRPFQETERAAFIRATYSRRQLVEVLADFWHNHFQVYGPDFWAGPTWVHYDRDIVRAGMLGNFRKLLEDVATSFQMLLFLDNHNNVVAGPNENYARELFELHGLGAENYLGIRRQDEVPEDAGGQPVGYVDDDVYEATRAFTGWGVDFGTGEFVYTASQHDRFQKYVLGRFLRSDQVSLKDGRDVLDLVAFHAGTARHVARKLCRRLVSDTPPDRLVEEAAAVFRARKDDANQLREVVRTILLSPEFRTTWGQKAKRPFEFAVGCLRATGAELSFAFGHEPSDHFMRAYFQAGQPLYQWTTPDGYADVKEKWLGSNAIVGGWKIVNWLADVKNWWDGRFVLFDPFAIMPATAKTPRAIAEFWISRLLPGRSIPEATRREIVEFMARGRQPDLELTGFQDQLTRERVWGLIALVLMVPENLLR
jgi:uncharacterized protein (DUF1800 family)